MTYKFLFPSLSDSQFIQNITCKEISHAVNLRNALYNFSFYSAVHNSVSLISRPYRYFSHFRFLNSLVQLNNPFNSPEFYYSLDKYSSLIFTIDSEVRSAHTNLITLFLRYLSKEKKLVFYTLFP